MFPRFLALLVPCAIAFLPALTPEAPGTHAAPAAATMTVDAAHSSVVFRVMHLNTSAFYGRFNRISGEVALGDKDGTVSIEVDVDSLDTNSSGRDGHLKSQEFFSAKEFPKITFKSRSVTKKDEGWEVAGDVTMHGVTKPLSVVVKQTGAGEDPRSGSKLAGYESTFTLKRSDFGMSYGVEKKMLGDDVTVMLAIEAVAKK